MPVTAGVSHKMKKGTFTSSLVLGHTTALTIASAVAIYGFDYYEKMYGKGISFQISLWFVVIGAVIAGIGFGIGVALSGWVSKYWVGLGVGGVFALVVMGLSAISHDFITNTGTRQFMLFIVWLGGSISIPLLASKMGNTTNG
jgi:hypothetical protein